MVVANREYKEEEVGTNPMKRTPHRGRGVQGSGTEFSLDALCPTLRGVFAAYAAQETDRRRSKLLFPALEFGSLHAVITPL